jgi:single-strand DNA-binding protein
MLNQTVIVGRLCSDPEVKELDSGKKVTNIKLAVSRPYKNEDGEYETDFIDVTLWDGVATNTAEYCRKGDLLGVKGRIETDSYEKNGEKKYTMSVIAEKVTFLSSQNKNREDSDRDDR